MQAPGQELMREEWSWEGQLVEANFKPEEMLWVVRSKTSNGEPRRWAVSEKQSRRIQKQLAI